MFGCVEKVRFTGERTVPLGSLKTEVYRIWPALLVAVPVWQLAQFGSMNQPTRLVEPTALKLPWQLWHCISIEPSAAIAPPIAPRRHFVVEPG